MCPYGTKCLLPPTADVIGGIAQQPDIDWSPVRLSPCLACVTCAAHVRRCLPPTPLLLRTDSPSRKAPQGRQNNSSPSGKCATYPDVPLSSSFSARTFLRLVKSAYDRTCCETEEDGPDNAYGAIKRQRNGELSRRRRRQIGGKNNFLRQ